MSAAQDADHRDRPVLLVGYKDDREGRHALRFAVTLANMMSADIHVLHIVDLSDYPIDPDSATWEADGETKLADEKVRAIAEFDALAGHGTYAASRGDPATALRESAEQLNALMVVIGTHGDQPGSGLARLLGGSVSRKLVRHLSRPVLVVPWNEHS